MVRRAARARGEPYDPRTDVDVIKDERIAGRKASPAVSPGYYFADNGSKVVSNGTPVLPLGIVPNTQSYYCNESGTPAKFETDRYGIRNPDTIWSELPADVFITGDSFGFGSCLPEKDSIAGQVRQSHPLTINAVQGGNGPLTELASIREFAVPTKARHVFWLFLRMI
jgi:hypothetical protein